MGSLFAQLEWIVEKAIAGTTVSMKIPAERGTPRGDTGKVGGTNLFDGQMFKSRDEMLASMLQYMSKLRHADGKRVGIGIVLEAPGAGKSFMLQRAYESPIAQDERTMRLIFSYNHNMNTKSGAVHYLVSRMLFTFFCGYPGVQVSGF